MLTKYNEKGFDSVRQWATKVYNALASYVICLYNMMIFFCTMSLWVLITPQKPTGLYWLVITGLFTIALCVKVELVKL